MANFSLVTVSKGEIKSVDGFIKTFNSIGHNMKVLAVSAYNFMTSDDKDLSIEFGKRVCDELNMSKATLSNLRTAGWLYSLTDSFEKFSYTNVILFKKNVEALEAIDDAHISQMFQMIALFANSNLADLYESDEEATNACVDFLASLSQKELKNVIDKFNAPVVDAEVIEEAPEESEPVEVEDVEEAKFYNIIDDDYKFMVDMLVTANEKMSKKELVERINEVCNRLLSYNN